MRFRNTLALLVVLLGLGAYVYYVEFPKAAEEEKKKTLVEFESDQVDEIKMVFPDRETTLKKVGGKWRITAPLEAEADELTVKSVLNTLSGAEVKRTLDDKPENLAVFSLDKPLAAVTLRIGEKTLPEIRIGKQAPVGQSTYVQIGDGKIMLTDTTFKSGVDKQLKDLREKTVLRFPDDQVSRIALARADGEIVLIKKDGTWAIESPSHYAADDTVVRSLISTLHGLRAVDFPDDNPTDLSKYELDPPRLTLVVTVGDAKHEILLGKENADKQVFAKIGARPTVYALNDFVYRDLDKKLTDLRDKTLLAFDKAKIGSIEIKRADGETMNLKREGDSWKLDSAESAPSAGKVAQYVADLHDLKGFEIAADGVADPSEFGLAPAAIAITVRGEDGGQIGTILLGQRDKDGKPEYLAMREGSGTVVVLREYLYPRLDKHAADFIAQPTPAPSDDEDTGGDEAAEEDLGMDE